MIIKHPVHKAMHRPLTIMGVDRRLFFGALATGAATFNVTYSLALGIASMVGIYAVALWAIKQDPKMLEILFSSTKYKIRYDPLKHAPYVVEVK